MREEDKETIKEALDRISASQERRRTAKKAAVPEVGIIFLVKGKSFIDSTPVTEAEGHAHFKIHDHGHCHYWAQLQGMGAVPKDMEYDEVPRGRVVYNTASRNYTLLADRCILKNSKLVSRIMAEMNLPLENAETDTDSHYRCPKCLKKAAL